MLKESAYSIKSVSVDAIIACVLAGLSVCCLSGAVIMSYAYNGKGPAAVGLLGIGSFLLAMCMEVCRWWNANEKNCRNL